MKKLIVFALLLISSNLLAQEADETTPRDAAYECVVAQLKIADALNLPLTDTFKGIVVVLKYPADLNSAPEFMKIHNLFYVKAVLADSTCIVASPELILENFEKLFN